MGFATLLGSPKTMTFSTRSLVLAFLIGSIAGWAWKEDTFYVDNQKLVSSLASCQDSKWGDVFANSGYDFTKE